MRIVRDILQEKGAMVHTIPGDATVFQALQTIADMEIGALVVVEGNDVAGIFTERDYARKIVLQGKLSREVPVREIMTPRADLTSVGPDQDLEQCMELITEKRVRHLPVFENDRLVGLVSIGDIVKSIIEHKEEIIEQLEKYIKGGR